MHSRVAFAGVMLALFARILLGHAPAAVYAAGGDLLDTIERPQGCLGGIKTGMGVAFYDGKIAYSCQNPFDNSVSTSIYRTNIDGADLGSAVVHAGTNPIPVEALAWDPVGQQMWMANRIPVGPLPLDGVCVIWRLNDIDGSPTAHFAFYIDGPDGSCDMVAPPSPFPHYRYQNFIDGLTFDYATNTIYLSYAGGQVIRHFNTNGTPAANDPINFTEITDGMCEFGNGCRSSGLMIGVDGTLISGAWRYGALIRIDPETKTVADTYTSAGGRDWDLECGPTIVNGSGDIVETVLSADLYSYNINVLEAPPDFCPPSDYAVSDILLMTDIPNTVRVGETVYGALAGRVGGPAGAADFLTKLSVWSAGTGVDSRVVAFPGDTCFIVERFARQFEWQCGEGDEDPGAPFVGGLTCYDGIDNDGDLDIDAADGQCQANLAHVGIFTPSGRMTWYLRYFQFTCMVPGETVFSIGASVPETATNAAYKQLQELVPVTCVE